MYIVPPKSDYSGGSIKKVLNNVINAVDRDEILCDRTLRKVQFSPNILGRQDLKNILRDKRALKYFFASLKDFMRCDY